MPVEEKEIEKRKFEEEGDGRNKLKGMTLKAYLQPIKQKSLQHI